MGFAWFSRRNPGHWVSWGGWVCVCMCGGVEDLGNVGRLLWHFGDHSRMILKNLGCYSSLIFQECNHGRSASPERKWAENVKVQVRSGKGRGPKGIQEDDGVTQALTLVLSSSICPLSCRHPASPPAAEMTQDQPWAQFSLLSSSKSSPWVLTLGTANSPATMPVLATTSTLQQNSPTLIVLQWKCASWHLSFFPQVISLASWGRFSLTVLF